MDAKSKTLFLDIRSNNWKKLRVFLRTNIVISITATLNNDSAAKQAALVNYHTKKEQPNPSNNRPFSTFETERLYIA